MKTKQEIQKKIKEMKDLVLFDPKDEYTQGFYWALMWVLLGK